MVERDIHMETGFVALSEIIHEILQEKAYGIKQDC